MDVAGDDYADPVGVVLLQDKCLTEDGIDQKRWASTVFLPLTMSSDGNVFTVEDHAGFTEHLGLIWRKAKKLGVARLRTRVLSHIQPSEGMSIVSSIRDRMAVDGTVIGSSSITWTLLLHQERWQINQILFNDGIYDPSIVAQTFLGLPNKEHRAVDVEKPLLDR